MQPNAVIIGAGHNGLVAANVLADAGWDVVVLEAALVPGGAVRSAEVTAPGFVNDLFSACYPFAAVSPALQSLKLERQGLRWAHAPAVLAHPRLGGPAAVLSRDIDRTAESLDAIARGDGVRWRDLYELYTSASPHLVDALLGPFPPVRSAARLAAALGPRRLAELGRLAMLPVRRLAEERFDGDGARLLLTGNALHADASPDGAGSGIYGWLMTTLAQDVGFPAPVGGAGALTEALVSRLVAAGGKVCCGEAVGEILVRDRRAEGVRLEGGDVIRARAVLADVDAVALYERLIAPEHLPARTHAALRRFERGPGTFKVDWALSGPIPWSDPSVAAAGVVHIGDSPADVAVGAAQVTSGWVPARPFTIVGQMTTTDPSRSPPGTESAWAYAHVPQRIVRDAGPDGITAAWAEREVEAFAGRIEDQIERHAPGFRTRVIARHTLSPPAMQAENANLVGGDLSGGTAQLHQQLFLRPIPGLGRPGTPIRGLYLASSSAHPGAGVHGACGANAARAARLGLRFGADGRG